MKASRDDAPEYLRPSARRSKNATWLVASLLGTGITLGLFYAVGSKLMHGTVDKLANNHRPQPAPIAEITRAAPPEKDWDKIVNDVASRSGSAAQPQTTPRIQPAPQPAKQTDYNAATYLPAHAVNVMPAARLTPQPQPTQRPKKQQEIVIVGKETRLRDYCPYREGSIERRNCKARIGLQHR